ncbi:response regulator [Rhodobacteraceae bacterium 2CG4]|uniref:Response regulator n=1 Tax=Halovulum marinum TaxID=2662447 RepID=A0A6L5Z316_9RHOB|nr:response regulator [Halovulum marinum]MSU90938.1 response regulator [Halovulum marinum]
MSADPPRPVRVLLVDDDADVREALGQALDLAGFRVTACKSFIEATDHLGPGFAGVVVTDVCMPGKDGLDLLARAQTIDPEIPVIVMTGHGDIPMAVRAMSGGAYDFLEKPCAPRALIERVARAGALRALVLQNRRLLAERTLAAAVERDAGGAGLARKMEAVEKHLIEAALRTHRGRVQAVAEALQLPRKTLYDKFKRHGIDPAAYRTGD